MPRFSAKNNLPGTHSLILKMAQLLQSGDFNSIEIAAEANGWHWFHFFQALSRDPLMNRWDARLYPLNPRITANFKKSYIDNRDAFVIADRFRTCLRAARPQAGRNPLIHQKMAIVLLGCAGVSPWKLYAERIGSHQLHALINQPFYRF